MIYVMGSKASGHVMAVKPRGRCGLPLAARGCGLVYSALIVAS